MRAVDHINVDVDDLEATYTFYRDELGLSVRRPPEEFDGEHAMFAVGDTVVTLAETGRADGWNRSDLEHPLDKAHLAFETDRASYDDYVDDLDGQFPNQGPYEWGEFEGFYFLDPDGNLLEVITYDPPVDGRGRELLTHDDVT